MPRKPLVTMEPEDNQGDIDSLIGESVEDNLDIEGAEDEEDAE